MRKFALGGMQVDLEADGQAKGDDRDGSLANASVVLGGILDGKIKSCEADLLHVDSGEEVIEGPKVEESSIITLVDTVDFALKAQREKEEGHKGEGGDEGCNDQIYDACQTRLALHAWIEDWSNLPMQAKFV